jgi:outer membrane protein OmpA-like peptidoglycan-associated protein
MAQLDPRLTPSSIARVLALATFAGALPLSSAFAQGLPQVRITDDTAVHASMRGRGDVVMRPEVGTVLEMIDMEGDRYSHRDGNWYLVLLPRDAWGFQRTGWVSGDDIELLPPPVRPRAAADAPLADLPARSGAANGAASIVAPGATRTVGNVAPPVAPVTPSVTAMSDLVLHFEFGRSELTPDARAALVAPATELKANAQAFAFSVEGHADWVGNETFNEKLGMARAETVRKFLSEQYQIPAEKMTIVSYGEGKPAASNNTAEGRAENRRVVVKVRP